MHSISFALFLSLMSIKLSYCEPVSSYWADEFNSPSTFHQNWYLYSGQAGATWGLPDNYIQNFTSQNVRVKNDDLDIITRKDETDIYTSARVISNVTFRFGTFEIRAKVPKGRGLWSTISLLPDKPNIVLPDDGEIRIMEHFGKDIDLIHAAVQCRRYSHQSQNEKHASLLVSDVYDYYHTYKLEWTPNFIRIFAEGLLYLEYTRETYSNYDTWPFINEFRLVISTAVSQVAGNIEYAILPVSFLIDYIRYTPLPDPSQGASATINGITWSDRNMSKSCDFPTKGYIAHIPMITPDLCYDECFAKPACSHYVFTMFDSGTCWLKAGKMSKDKAFKVNDPSMACGLVERG